MDTIFQNSIPVIDISCFLSDQPQDLDILFKKQLVAQEIRQACINIGFFYIQNHKVPKELIQQTFSNANDFFSLPQEKKDENKLNSIFRGYFALGKEITKGVGDCKEGYDLGLELPLDHPDVVAKKPLHGPNPWPPLPAFKETMLCYCNALMELGKAITRGIALSLELKEDYFNELYGSNPILFFRLLNYPSTQIPTLGVGEHTDYGCITILAQDEVGGLQIMNKQGEWQTAPPIPDTFVVNIGDMLQIWTNDHYQATLHRVITSNKRRQSLAFCYEPNFDSIVIPVSTCTKEAPSKYQPISYGEYVMQKINSSFPKY